MSARGGSAGSRAAACTITPERDRLSPIRVISEAGDDEAVRCETSSESQPSCERSVELDRNLGNRQRTAVEGGLVREREGRDREDRTDIVRHDLEGPLWLEA